MRDILLHTCCAPCSAAIIEWMLANDWRPTLYYCNPNIFPEAEYIIRKNECTRYAQQLGLNFIDGDYDHAKWLAQTAAMASCPERGQRCLLCFKIRLLKTAQVAQQMGIEQFATTLASSRWKSLAQITEAGCWAVAQVPGITFYDKNWRKDGLQQRRSELLAQNGFYNQTYCGCEFSLMAAQNKEKITQDKSTENVQI